MTTKKQTVKNTTSSAMDKTTSTMTISKVDHARIKDLMEQSDYKVQGEFLSLIIDQFMGFSVDDLAKLKQAAAASNMTVESIAISGAMQYADKLIAMTKDGAKESPDLKINKFVNDLIAQNETATNWFEKIEITQRVISEGTGCNRANITRFLDANKARLKDHHATNGIEQDHNRRASNQRAKNAKLAV